MKTKNKLLFALIGYFLLLIGAWFVRPACDKWNYLSTLAIILTGAILIWYTWETTLLRTEAQRQTELQLRPFVLIVPFQKEFKLRNIGNGPALNISLADVQVDAPTDITIQFPDFVPFLQKGEETAIRAESYKKRKPCGDFFNAHLFPEYSNRPLTLKIEFQNIESQNYVVKETISPNKMTIEGIETCKTS